LIYKLLDYHVIDSLAFYTVLLSAINTSGPTLSFDEYSKMASNDQKW